MSQTSDLKNSCQIYHFQQKKTVKHKILIKKNLRFHCDMDLSKANFTLTMKAH